LFHPIIFNFNFPKKIVIAKQEDCESILDCFWNQFFSIDILGLCRRKQNFYASFSTAVSAIGENML
jgi:hypothetical protein